MKHTTTLKIGRRLAAIGVIGLFTTCAQATSVTWTLENVGFNIGGIGTYITGSFAYDLTTNTFSEVDLASTATGPLLDPEVLSSSGYELLEVVSGTGDLTGDLEMFMSFKTALYGPYGTDAVRLDGIGTCTNPTCGATSNTIGFGNGSGLGYVTSVPEPESLALFGSALLSLWAARRRSVRLGRPPAYPPRPPGYARG